MFQSNRIEHFPQITGINSGQINHTFSENSIDINNIAIIKNLTRDQHGIKRKMNSYNYRDRNKTQKRKNCDICYNCYIDHKVCKSWFLPIEIISPHYPMIRYIKRLIHNLINFNEKLNKLHKALNDVDINALQDIVIKTRQKAKTFAQVTTEINLNEDEIQSQYCFAFKAFTKRSLHVPKYVCISCTKYCFKKDYHGKN